MATSRKNYNKTLTQAIKLLGKPLFILIQILALILVFISLLINSIQQSISNIISTINATLKKRKATKSNKKQKRKATKKKKKSQQSKIKRFLSFCIKLSIYTIIVVSIDTFMYRSFLKDFPSPNDISTNTPALTTKIYDRNGTLLYKIYKDENRSLTSLDNLPKHLINATISAEDKNFYTHKGVSVEGIIRALKRNIQNNSITTSFLCCQKCGGFKRRNFQTSKIYRKK